MLVLARFKDESITITTPKGRVVIRILSVDRRGKVQLGIEAPRSIEVHRTEIQLRIDNEKGVTNGTIVDMPSQAR